MGKTTTPDATSATRFRHWVGGLLLLLIHVYGASAAASEAEVVDVEPVPLLTEAELRELVSPIALYPDDLLAIVLPASTYPLQIVAAARYRLAAEEDDSLEPNEDWDESIVALLNYPEALEFLNADIDWTWELGQAVLEQQEDVLAAVTSFRQEAIAAGNLDSDDRQEVAVEEDTVTIRQVEPEVIYVPYYEPEAVTVYQQAIFPVLPKHQMVIFGLPARREQYGLMVMNLHMLDRNTVSRICKLFIMIH